jgi:hypothetical protein
MSRFLVGIDLMAVYIQTGMNQTSVYVDGENVEFWRKDCLKSFWEEIGGSGFKKINK